MKQFGFCQFSLFWSILAVFWPKNGQKRLKSKNNFFAAFSVVGKHLHTKFQKKLLDSLDFANFLHFGQFLLLLGQKKAK